MERSFLDLLNEAAAPAPPACLTPEPPTETLPGNTENKPVPPPKNTTSTRGNTGTTGGPRRAVNSRTSSAISQSQPASKRRTPVNMGTATALPVETDGAGGTPEPLPPDSPAAAERARSVRQTFVLSYYHLDRLRDYVHARRVRGEYTFSQKEALELALDWLFAQEPPVTPRPLQVREREQRQGDLIRNGRRPSQSD